MTTPSNQSIPITQLQTSPAAAFNELGQGYDGKIVAIDQRQQTDPKNGQVKYFASGDPMTQWVITLEQSDGQTTQLYAKGGRFKAEKGTGESMLNAIASAIKAAGAASLDVGGRLAVKWTGEGEARPGLNAPKLYTAQYAPPPAASVKVDDLFTQ